MWRGLLLSSHEALRSEFLNLIHTFSALKHLLRSQWEQFMNVQMDKLARLCAVYSARFLELLITSD